MQEDLAGEGVVARMQRLELAQQLEYLDAAGQPVEQDPPGSRRVLGSGPCASHTQTVGQNRSARLDLRQPWKMPDRDLITAARDSVTGVRRSTPASWAGSSTLSATVRSSTELKNWKIIASWVRR